MDRRFLKTRIDLRGNQEVPPVVTNMFGYAKIRIDPNRCYLRYKIKVRFPSSNIIAAHFHLGEQGVNGPILLNLNTFMRRGNYFVSKGNILSLDNSIINNIVTGNTYINVHTRNYPDGEIRGQVIF